MPIPKAFASYFHFATNVHLTDLSRSGVPWCKTVLKQESCCNAQMTDRMMQEYCALDAASSRLLNTAMERLDLSARAYSRILKVARTIADLEGSAQIQQHHIAEAVGYRNLDRGNWGE